MILLLIANIGFEYMLVDPVAERVGMGYALYGDGHSIHYNPAGIILNAGTSYSFSYLNYIGGTHFGYVDYESNRWGIGVRYFYSGKMKKTDALGQELGNFSTNFLDLNIGKAFEISTILLGASGKFIYELIDTLYSAGLGIDLGGLYFLPQENIQLGLAVKNLGIGIKPFISEKELLPYEINLSAIYNFNQGWIGLDVVKPALINFGIRFGAGYNFTEFLTFRVSYNSLLSQVRINTGLDFLAGISLGFGVKKNNINVNYSYTPYFNLGQAHRLTVRIGG